MSYDKQKMIDAVMRLWDMGMDTLRIATVLQIKQDEAERFLNRGLDQRKGKCAESS